MGLTRSFVIYDDGDQLQLVKRAMREARRGPASCSRARSSTASTRRRTRRACPDDMEVDADDLRGHGGAEDLPGLPAAAARGERGGLRRPAAAAGDALPQAPGRAGSVPAALPARAGGRVPGHQPGAVRAAAPAGAAAGGRTWWWWATTTSPSTAGAARAWTTSSASREDVPGRAGGEAGAELPLGPEHPRRGARGHRAATRGAWRRSCGATGPRARTSRC